MAHDLDPFATLAEAAARCHAACTAAQLAAASSGDGELSLALADALAAATACGAYARLGSDLTARSAGTLAIACARLADEPGELGAACAACAAACRAFAPPAGTPS